MIVISAFTFRLLQCADPFFRFPEQAIRMFSDSVRLPFLAVVGLLAIAGCDQSNPTPAYAPQDSAPVEEPAQPAVASTGDPATQAGPTTLTEIDEASRSAQMSASGMCSFDKINKEKVSAESPVRVQNAFTASGWVVERGTMTRPQAVLRLREVNGGRAWEIGVGPGTSRGDVGRYLKAEGLTDAGFEVEVDLSAVPPGEYTLSLNHYSGGRRVVCDKGTRIIVGA